MSHTHKRVVDLCEYVHTHLSGSAQGLSTAFLAGCVDELRLRLSKWKAPHPRWQRYDDAVKSLVEATIAEWEGR